GRNGGGERTSRPQDEAAPSNHFCSSLIGQLGLTKLPSLDSCLEPWTPPTRPAAARATAATEGDRDATSAYPPRQPKRGAQHRLSRLVLRRGSEGEGRLQLPTPWGLTEAPGISVFTKDGDQICLTYSTYERGSTC